jgi:hypothetical protein
MRTVDFFIVGAPKCGTTAMYSYLKSHPDVFFPEKKEPHFFGRDLDFSGRPRMTFEEYLQLYSDAKPNQKLGDASVFYLLSKTAAQELKAYNPDAKIIIMLRNPVDAMHSFHSQRLYNGTEDIEDFADAIAAEADRREGRRMPARIGLRQGLFYHEVVSFADQVERYFEAFGRAPIHIILHEDLCADLPGCFRNLCAFLGIDTSHEPVFDAVNANKVVRFPWLRDALAERPRALSLAGRMLLPSASLRRRLRDAIKSMNRVTQRRIPIPPEVRSRVLNELGPSIEKLEQLLDRDLGSWRSASC